MPWYSKNQITAERLLFLGEISSRPFILLKKQKSTAAPKTGKMSLKTLFSIVNEFLSVHKREYPCPRCKRESLYQAWIKLRESEGGHCPTFMDPLPPSIPGNPGNFRNMHAGPWERSSARLLKHTQAPMGVLVQNSSLEFFLITFHISNKGLNNWRQIEKKIVTIGLIGVQVWRQHEQSLAVGATLSFSLFNGNDRWGMKICPLKMLFLCVSPFEPITLMEL